MVESIELDELDLTSVTNKEILNKKDIDLVSHVKTSAQILLGDVELTVGELLSLKSGSVLISKASINESMTLVLNGKPIAKGNLVVVDDHFGFEVTAIKD